MNKAFIKETDDDDEPLPPEPIGPSKNYVTPRGYALLRDELRHLVTKERPQVVETVRWAAGNGDRSENGDYIYGKRRLREIDRRIRYLTKKVESAIVVDPSFQQALTKVFFGATVTYTQEQETKTVKIVGVDEANVAEGTISWISPLAKALLKSSVDDIVEFKTPGGKQSLKIVDIVYLLMPT